MRVSQLLREALGGASIATALPSLRGGTWQGMSTGMAWREGSCLQVGAVAGGVVAGGVVAGGVVAGLSLSLSLRTAAGNGHRRARGV